MSGWRRLWIVLSLLFGVPVFWVEWEANKTLTDFVSRPKGQSSEVFWALANASPKLKNCVEGTMRPGDYPIGSEWPVSCENKKQFEGAFLWSLVPALVMAVIGLTARWIYRGFRPPAK